jgi:hypothetical protein
MPIILHVLTTEPISWLDNELGSFNCALPGIPLALAMLFNVRLITAGAPSSNAALR